MDEGPVKAMIAKSADVVMSVSSVSELLNVFGSGVWAVTEAFALIVVQRGVFAGTKA